MCSHQRRPVLIHTALASATLAVALSACGSPAAAPLTPASTSSGAATVPTSHPTEFNPPGDIPDTAVYVDRPVPGTTVHVAVPEGWAQSAQGTTCTDKYNSISIRVISMPTQPTLATVRRDEVPRLASSQSKFALTGIAEAQRTSGKAILITYLIDSTPDQVTGKVVRDAVQQFDFWHAGHEAILTLTGPQSADNVDPWKRVSDSLRWN